MAADDAVRTAREVVGLYGDPEATWGIAVELGFDAPLDVGSMEERLVRLVADHPHLGRRPVVEVVADPDWSSSRSRSAAEPYGDHDPLVRVSVDASGNRLLVAAHHGVCDGLGLLAVADYIGALELVSHARGIGERTSPQPFLSSSLGRVSEAVRRPPVRLRSHTGPGAAGTETLLSRQVEVQRRGTAAFCHALAETFLEWNAVPADADARLLVVMGASRRKGGLEPDRQTAFLRFPMDARWWLARVRSEFAALEPEPTYPETSAWGVGPLVTRLLRRRLGSTAQVSNLGIVEAPGLASVAMFPSLNGPRAVALGLATTRQSTTVTVRTRGGDFGPADTEALLDDIVRRFAGGSGSPDHERQ